MRKQFEMALVMGGHVMITVITTVHVHKNKSSSIL